MFVRLLIFGIICTVVCVKPSTLAQNSSPSERQSPPSTDSRTPAKKVWTNENIPSVGAGSVAGGSAPSSCSLVSNSNGATFINPKEGQLVRPGEILHIDLVVDSSITPNKALGIFSTMGFSHEAREGPPYSFTFTIPDKDLSDASSHRLIGLQQLTLVGAVVGRKDFDLATTTVDVEESDLPVSFSAAGDTISQRDRIANHVSFIRAGSDQRLEIYAKFPNGHELDVTESTYLSLSSENPAVAVVGEIGTVTSVGPGETRIIASYSLGTQHRLFYIPVTVEASSDGLIASPATFNFGDVRSNTSSDPLQITVTNQTKGEIQISKLERADYVSSENCSDTTLAPGGSCTITVIFAPIGPGPVHINIFIPNSQTGILSLSLFGKGT
jgi:hypothetical protein